MTVLIVGAGVAGIVCATRLRRINEGAQIILIDTMDSVPQTHEICSIYNIDLRLNTFVTWQFPGAFSLHDASLNESYQQNFDCVCIFNAQDDIMAGRNRADEISRLFRPAMPDISITNGFLDGYEFAEVGLNEQALIEQSKQYMYCVLPMNMGFLTLYFSGQGEIYGFSALGRSIARYVDTAYAIMACKGGVFALANTKSHTNDKHMQTLGKIAQNTIEGHLKITYPDQMAKLDLSNTTILDVRNHDEIQSINFPEAVHIPLPHLRTEFLNLDEKKHIVVVCKSGKRAYVAARFLSQRGYNASILTGGMDYYVHTSARPHGI